MKAYFDLLEAVEERWADWSDRSTRVRVSGTDTRLELTRTGRRDLSEVVLPTALVLFALCFALCLLYALDSVLSIFGRSGILLPFFVLVALMGGLGLVVAVRRGVHFGPPPGKAGDSFTFDAAERVFLRNGEVVAALDEIMAIRLRAVLRGRGEDGPYYAARLAVSLKDGREIDIDESSVVTWITGLANDIADYAGAPVVADAEVRTGQWA
jgi:hypothetical protein